MRICFSNLSMNPRKVMAGQPCATPSLSLTIVLMNFLYPIIFGAPNQSLDFYGMYPLMSTRQKITDLRNGYTGDNIQQNRSFMSDLVRREDAERESNMPGLQAQLDNKRNVPATPQCETDDAELCLKKRHHKCSVFFPESENAQDSNCKIRLDCGFSCSARCFAVLQAFPFVSANTQFRFSVATYYENGNAHFPLRTWNGRLQGDATNISGTILQSYGSIGGRFRITSSFNCSNLVPCDYNLASLQTP